MLQECHARTVTPLSPRHPAIPDWDVKSSEHHPWTSAPRPTLTARAPRNEGPDYLRDRQAGTVGQAFRLFGGLGTNGIRLVREGNQGPSRGPYAHVQAPSSSYGVDWDERSAPVWLSWAYVSAARWISWLPLGVFDRAFSFCSRKGAAERAQPGWVVWPLASYLDAAACSLSRFDFSTGSLRKPHKGSL